MGTGTLVIPDKELLPYVSGNDLAEKAHGLLEQQKVTWELLRGGYASLATVRTRVFTFDSCTIHVQYNPGRLTSSSAKVDEQSIRKRTCFLCPANLPADQRGLFYRDRYYILCNPFPIFPEHFTISSSDHIPQRILPSFGTLLDLAKDMAGRYVVFYNGPQCGASAPDHLHFQAGNKDFMPIAREYETVISNHADLLLDRHDLRVYGVERYLRSFVSLESSNSALLVRAFGILYRDLQEVTAALNPSPPGGEPMMNILAFCERGQWRVIIFPRAKHRPSFYFEEGDKRILLSPAAVDLGGVCITPLEEDFNKISEANIVDMFREISLTAELFRNLKERVSKKFLEGM